MHNNYHFFLQLIPEVKPKLVGLKLMDCFSQEKDEMVLGFAAARGIKNNYKQYFIRCSVAPAFAGLYFTKDYKRAKKNSINLWENLYDLEVLDVSVFNYERAFKIQLEKDFSIVFKMFGNRSNILVFEGNKIIFVFNKSIKNDFNLSLESFGKQDTPSIDSFDRNIKKSFPTLGKVVGHYLKEQTFEQKSLAQQKEILQNLLQELANPTYLRVTLDGISYLSLIETGTVEETFEDPITASNRFFVYGQRFLGLEKEKQQLLKLIQREIKQCEKYLIKSQNRIDELKTSTSNQEIGHIIMANLHLIQSRAKWVTLHDFYNNREIQIKLKEDLSPQQNAENYYRKAKNEKVEERFLIENSIAREQKLEELHILKDKIESLENLKEVRKLAAEFNGSQTQNTAQLFKEFEKDGWRILVGRNAKNNDLLTLKYAKKNDLWLHARDVAGSHVVIKEKPGSNVPEYIIEYAASIAAHFSKRKTDSLAPVIYTQKKYVRKIKGTSDGQVRVEKEQVVMVPPLSAEHLV